MPVPPAWPRRRAAPPAPAAAGRGRRPAPRREPGAHGSARFAPPPAARFGPPGPPPLPPARARHRDRAASSCPSLARFASPSASAAASPLPAARASGRIAAGSCAEASASSAASRSLAELQLGRRSSQPPFAAPAFPHAPPRASPPAGRVPPARRAPRPGHGSPTRCAASAAASTAPAAPCSSALRAAASAASGDAGSAPANAASTSAPSRPRRLPWPCARRRPRRHGAPIARPRPVPAPRPPGLVPAAPACSRSVRLAGFVRRIQPPLLGEAGLQPLRQLGHAGLGQSRGRDAGRIVGQGGTGAIDLGSLGGQLGGLARQRRRLLLQLQRFGRPALGECRGFLQPAPGRAAGRHRPSASVARHRPGSARSLYRPLARGYRRLAFGQTCRQRRRLVAGGVQAQMVADAGGGRILAARRPDEPVPAPQAAVAAHQALTGTEQRLGRCRVRGVDEADLPEPGVQHRGALISWRSGCGALGQIGRPVGRGLQRAPETRLRRHPCRPEGRRPRQRPRRSPIPRGPPAGRAGRRHPSRGRGSPARGFRPRRASAERCRSRQPAVASPRACSAAARASRAASSTASAAASSASAASSSACRAATSAVGGGALEGCTRAPMRLAAFGQPSAAALQARAPLGQRGRRRHGSRAAAGPRPRDAGGPRQARARRPRSRPLGLALRLDRHELGLGHGHLPSRLGQRLQLQGEPGLGLMLGGPASARSGRAASSRADRVAAGLQCGGSLDLPRQLAPAPRRPGVTTA